MLENWFHKGFIDGKRSVVLGITILLLLLATLFIIDRKNRASYVLSSGGRVWVHPEASFEVLSDQPLAVEIEMKGRGYFEINMRGGEPLVIQTSDVQIATVGASFLLEVEERTTTVYVKEDSLVMKNQSGATLMLSSGQMGEAHALHRGLIRKSIDKAMDWRGGEE